MDDGDFAKLVESGRAWEEFCDGLKAAGKLVLERSPAHDIDRVEGFRYLTRLLRMGLKFGLEYGDPAAPELVEYMNETQKFGIDNPDQLYQLARISGDYTYRLHGPRGSASYVAIGVYAGSAGRGGIRTVAHRRAEELQGGPRGDIDVVLSPHAQPGCWIATTRDTTTLLVRQTMNDRGREVPAQLTLERLDMAAPPPPLSAERLVRGLRRAVQQVQGSTRMFCDLADAWAQPVNVFHPRDDAVAAQAFGDPHIYYSPFYWKVAADEALIIELTPPECDYWMVLLCNYWAESLDYRYHPVWTNKSSATYRADGSVQIIVAHEKPAVADATWLDPAEHTEGTGVLRYLNARTTPLPATRLAKLQDVARSR